MRRLAFVSVLLLVAGVSSAYAQVIPPIPVTGPAHGVMRQLYPPAPLDQVREQSLRRSPPLPVPPPASERWVPEQQKFVPELGRIVTIPGHYDQRVTDQQVSVPPLPVFDRTTGFSTTLPAADRTPPDVRQTP